MKKSTYGDKAESRYGYDVDNITPLEAITEAQKIAFAPILFQAAINLRDYGILTLLDNAGKLGCDIDFLTENCQLNSYAVQLLLDVGLSSKIIYTQNKRYFLTKIGHFLLHDKMTRINMNFTQDICYQGMFHLNEALQNETPAGLTVFGEWPTIYHALSQLPEKARKSWFEFDHYYSDSAFEAAFSQLKKCGLTPKHIYDIGGNTGKWALCCVAQDPLVHVTILDLPQQITLAKKNIAEKGQSHRISGYGINLLDVQTLPGEADLWWMSQFLDCFSQPQIIHILKCIYNSMKCDAKIAILDVFWDRQPYEAGALTLNAGSLYFTCMANGKSRFYHSDVFYDCLQKAGFKVEHDIDNIGLAHTLLICSKVSEN